VVLDVWMRPGMVGGLLPSLKSGCVLARLVALPRTAPGVTILEWRVVAVGVRP
jgi:hypothetical protein